jgi:hypothetical protein
MYFECYLHLYTRHFLDKYSLVEYLSQLLDLLFDLYLDCSRLSLNIFDYKPDKFDFEDCKKLEPLARKLDYQSDCIDLIN